MNDPTIDPAVCDRLAAHLDSLDLDDQEQLLLDTILDRAAGVGADEVGGFGFEVASKDQRQQEQARKLVSPSLSPGGIRIAEAGGFKL